MKKKFEAMKFQRNVRTELGKKYSSNREVLLCDLKEKYGNLQRQMSYTHMTPNTV